MLGISLPATEKCGDIHLRHVTPDETFASCRINTLSVSGSPLRNHLSPFGLL